MKSSVVWMCGHLEPSLNMGETGFSVQCGQGLSYILAGRDGLNIVYYTLHSSACLTWHCSSPCTHSVHPAEGSSLGSIHVLQSVEMS